MLFGLPDPKIILMVIVVFVPLERLFALHKEQKIFRKGWRTDALYLLLNGIFIGTGINLILFCIVYVSSTLLPRTMTDWVGNLPIWLQLPVMLILADLLFYAVHRLFHEVPMLWKFHAVHHSSEQLDWLAAYRVHPLDQICTKGASLIPVLTLGFSTESMAVFFLIYHWQSIFVHSNTRFRFGFLEHLVATPRFHHWHHANEMAAYDKNYASQLPVIDAVFGTLHMPDAMPSAYGTHEILPPRYTQQLYIPIVQLFSRPKSQPETK
jgi:sterol desaturase/sphingolipid hydroxylase (fatty acid hydroxylase superfamily)